MSDEIYLLTLVTFMLISILIKNEDYTIRRTNLDVILFLIFLIYLISAFLNQTPLINILHSFKDYFFPFLFYYTILYSNRLNKKSVNKLLYYIFVIFCIQFIIQVFQILYTISFGSFNDDTARGGFSSANNLSYTYFFLLLHSAFMIYLYKDKIYIKRFFVFISGMLASFGLYAIVAFPLIFTIYNFKTFLRTQHLKKIFLLSLVFLLLFATFERLNPQRHNSSNPFWIFSPTYYVNYFIYSEFSIYGGSNRMLWFPVTLSRLETYAFHPFIGMGPGVYASFAGFRTMAPPTASIYNIFGQIENGFDPYVDSQLIPLIGELGYFGLALFLLLFILLMAKNYEIYKKGRTRLTKALGITASASSLYMIIGMYINHFIETQTIMIAFITLVSLAEVMYRNENKQKSSANRLGMQ